MVEFSELNKSVYSMECSDCAMATPLDGALWCLSYEADELLVL